MKKLIALLLLTASTSMVQAQQVFTEIKESAQKQIDNPHTPEVVKAVNRFKVDALNYLGMKMKEEMPDSSAAYLDNQAYALFSFINLYTKTLHLHRNDPQKEQLANIKMFVDASVTSPLFADKEDMNYVLSYCKDPDSSIRFSLDTNWVTAYMKVSEQLKKK